MWKGDCAEVAFKSGAIRRRLAPCFGGVKFNDNATGMGGGGR